MGWHRSPNLWYKGTYNIIRRCSDKHKKRSIPIPLMRFLQAIALLENQYLRTTTWALEDWVKSILYHMCLRPSRPRKGRNFFFNFFFSLTEVFKIMQWQDLFRSRSLISILCETLHITFVDIYLDFFSERGAICLIIFGLQIPFFSLTFSLNCLTASEFVLIFQKLISRMSLTNGVFFSAKKMSPSYKVH